MDAARMEAGERLQVLPRFLALLLIPEKRAAAFHYICTALAWGWCVKSWSHKSWIFVTRKGGEANKNGA
jgi:hypothetical protein